MNDEEKDHLRKGTTSVSLTTAAIAGSASGLVSRTVTAPLDILKIRLQLSQQRMTISKVFRSIYANEGILLFWKGNVPLSFMYIIYGSTQFASYSIANTALSRLDEEYLHIGLNANVHSFIVGSISGISSTLVSYPFDLLRTTLASNELKKFNKLAHVSREIYVNNGGIVGFYKGLQPSLVSVTIYMGVMFQTYEFCKNLVRNSRNTIDKEGGNFIVNVIDPSSGLISGIVAKTVTFPLDLVRKRLQVSRGVGRGGKTSMMILKEIVRSQGVKGLFNGLSLALLKSGPVSAVSFFVYEHVVGVINKLHS